MRLAELHSAFDSQIEFAKEYSPLYARLWSIVTDCLHDEAHAITQWLVTVAPERQAFDLTLLLAAGLHRMVLQGRSALGDYYATVGGSRTSGADYKSEAFAETVRQTILDNQAELTEFCTHANIQTNETGRGLVTLLVLAAWQIDAVHLAELGASAGLNLLSTERNYRVVDGSEKLLSTFGRAQAEQFTAQTPGLPPQLSNNPSNLPKVLTRTGCDLMPFALQTELDELTLASYVWADQPVRIDRLREGIAAFKAAQAADADIQIHPIRLPDELGNFLEIVAARTQNSAPILLYNTVMGLYLPDKGRSMGDIIRPWGMAQQQPVVWVQLENSLLLDEEPPYYGWMKISAEIYTDTQQTFNLGWSHAHVHTFELSDEWVAFAAALNAM